MSRFQPPIKPNDILSNQEICNIFKVAPRSGMRRSRRTNTLVLISDPTREKYSDRWEGKVLQYTGMGLRKDQSLSFQQNKTLYESNINGVDVHLFEVKKRREYTYRGKVYLAGKPHQEKQVDEDGNMRNVWMFPIKIEEAKNQPTNDKYIPETVSETSVTGYWTFFCNPKKWAIDEFLETNIEYDTYQVTEWQKHWFKPGQLGIIRVGNDSRNKKELNGKKKLTRGIYAIVEVVSESKQRTEKDKRFWGHWDDSYLNKPIVQIRYIKNLLTKPLTLKLMSNNATIKTDKYLLKGFQASSMPLKTEVFEEIINLTGQDKSLFENIELSQAKDNNDIKSLEEKFQNAVPQVKEVVSKRIERGPLGQKVKRLTGFKCMICEKLKQNPYVFKKPNGEYFIESHHVMQVSKKDEGVLGITNLITVCPNHHRQIHYGKAQLIDTNKKEFTFNIDGKKVVIKKIILK